ncbi:unnamed protein product [Parnassius mnemosyne]|uniref:Uncharacterized protein n=1 Tax=Parnassius mnemosyne TaxID=213953 RepID=A0AAV1LF11_9NEOP
MPLLKSLKAGTSINTQYNSDPSINTFFVDDEEQVTNTKYDELLQRMTVLEQENLHYKKYVQELENKLDYLEKFSRSTNLEMRNIPKQDNENRRTLLDISKKVGSIVQLEPNLQDAEIRDIYRTKTQTIVIAYMSTSRQENFL